MMYETTDIQTLGADYTVADMAGNFIKMIQVIPLSEILDAALGPYTDDFESYTAYIEESIATLSGFEDIDPNKVLWYATSDEKVELSEIFQYAIIHDYDRIILEHLDNLE